MRCPVCNKRMARNPHRDDTGPICPGCGYEELEDDFEEYVPAEAKTVPMKGEAKGKPRAAARKARAKAKKEKSS